MPEKLNTEYTPSPRKTTFVWSYRH